MSIYRTYGALGALQIFFIVVCYLLVPYFMAIHGRSIPGTDDFWPSYMIFIRDFGLSLMLAPVVWIISAALLIRRDGKPSQRCHLAIGILLLAALVSFTFLALGRAIQGPSYTLLAR